MDELEARVRDMLDERAATVRSIPNLSPDIATHVKRRRRRRGGVVGATLALVVVLGAALAGLSETPETSTQVAVQPGPSETPDTSTEVAVQPDPSAPAPLRTGPGGLAVAGGQVIDLSVAPPETTDHVPGIVTGSMPVVTRFGLLVVTFSSQRRALWLVPSGDEPPTLLAEHASTFAVASDGRTVVWAEVPPVASARDVSTVLVMARLPDGQRVHSTRVDGPASVAGFAGDVVMMGTGDGAASGAAIWLPDAGRIVPVPPDDRGISLVPGPVTHQPSAQAVLAQGSSGCDVLATVGSDGVVTVQQPMSPSGVECIRALAFSPDGRMLVGRIGPDGIVVRSLADDREMLRVRVAGNPQQAVWLDDDQYLVLSAVHAGRYEIVHCRTSAGSCTPAWSGSPESVPSGAAAVQLVGRPL